MDGSARRRSRDFRPIGEAVEGRLLLSGVTPPGILRQQGFFHPVRPNTPVLPFGEVSSNATFIDPSSHIVSGNTIAIATKTFIGPYSLLNGAAGYIKIGVGSAVLDNAQVIANPQRLPGFPGIAVGNSTLISFGAVVRGPATVGSLVPNAAPTFVGPNALIDGATISPGAYVSGLARVGPGVTVPAGIKVLPGANVTTEAEATNPALGKVTTVTAADLASVRSQLTNAIALAGGYANVYQGNSATGASPSIVGKGVFNGNLAAVLGSGQEPGTSFEPGALTPTFAAPGGFQLPGQFSTFRARATGGVNFHGRPARVAHHLGFHNAIRGDQGQPINIADSPFTGSAVTINSPLGGQVNLGPGLNVGFGAVLLGGTGAPLAVGNDVTIGDGAVVQRSIINNGATIGSRAYISDSTIPAGANIPAGTIIVANKVTGTVQW